MAKPKKNLSALQAWMDSKPGQMFLNYAYSWGASIVILGALFKLTHIAGANLMLFLGMGTEVVVFFLAGFERPYEDDGAEQAVPVSEGAAGDGGDEPSSGGTVVIGGGGVPAGGTIIIGGGGGGGYASAPAAAAVPAAAADGAPVDAGRLADDIASAPLPAMGGMSPEMQAATEAYVEQLTALTDTLRQVAEQSQRLTRDSEEMESMNRTLTGINRFYEMQLRSVGQQSASLDDVNVQTKRLAQQLAELNDVYARMVEALKMKLG